MSSQVVCSMTKLKRENLMHRWQRIKTDLVPQTRSALGMSLLFTSVILDRMSLKFGRMYDFQLHEL